MNTKLVSLTHMKTAVWAATWALLASEQAVEYQLWRQTTWTQS